MRQRQQNGSLQQRGSNWIGLYYAHGERRCKTLGPLSIQRGHAQRLLDDLIEEENTKPRRREWTFESFTNDVVFPLYRGKWKHSTAFTTEERFRIYLFPAIGKEPLMTIERANLQALLDKLAKRLSFHVVAHLRWDLNLAFNVASAEGVITKNPATLLYVPRHAARTTTRVLTKEDLTMVLRALPLRERLIVKLAGIVGMRPGEIEGLQWHDRTNEGLRITRRIYRRQVDTPKTHHSVRTAALSDSINKDLDEWANLRRDHADHAWVFPSENDKNPVSLTNVLLRNSRPRLPKELRWVNYQALRRTASTLLRSVAGADAKLVADQLGHTVDVNLTVYTKSVNADQAAALNRLDHHLMESNGINNKKD